MTARPHERSDFIPPWQDISTLCANTCLCEATVETWIKKGLLPPGRLRGGKRMWKWSEVSARLSESGPPKVKPKTIQQDRKAAWAYCRQTAAAIKSRAASKGLAYDIDAHHLDQLIIDQKWKCAVSGFPLNAPGTGKRDPFGPSIDRATPSLGYTRGNVRVVCLMVNTALGNWGEEHLMALFDFMAGREAR